MTKSFHITVLFTAVAFFTCTAAAGDTIYKWTDASGQDNFTNDPNNIPAQYRKKAKEDAESDSSQQPSKKSAPPTHPVRSTTSYSPKPVKSKSKSASTSIFVGEPNSGNKSPMDQRDPVKLQKEIDNLKSLLEKKNAELNKAFLWESMVRSPRYTEDKVRLMGEIEKIKKDISTNEQKLNELTRTGRPQ